MLVVFVVMFVYLIFIVNIWHSVVLFRILIVR